MSAAERRSGCLFILVAPAGAGKNALMNVVKAQVPGLTQLPTATTRPPRPGEAQGREHLFVSEDTFLSMIENNALLEWQQVHGVHYYGVPRATVEAAIAEGRYLIADIDYLGANAIRTQFPEHTVLVFIQPPSIRSLSERMRARGDGEHDIARWLLRARVELAFAAQCDYLIVNEAVAQAGVRLFEIIMAERLGDRTGRGQAVPVTLNVTYTVNLVAACQGDVLLDEQGHGLQADVNEGETPHDTALRLVRQAGWAADEQALIGVQTVGKPKLAPLAALVITLEAGERVNLYYGYPLQQRLALAGYGWQSATHAQLPTAVVTALSQALPELTR